MINLAGVYSCDEFIRGELAQAKIDIITVPIDTRQYEVPFTLKGELGPFKFYRAWYYWVVNGPMPLAMANRIYDDPNGRLDVRVAGHCGCPPPNEWEDQGFVNSYHIDSQEGLNLFADCVREVLSKNPNHV